jgi:hypothetical protein
LQAVDNAMLTPLVQKALSSPGAAITNWRCEPVAGGFGGGIGGSFIYRFTGDAQDGDDTIGWSLILKIVRAHPEQQPTHTHYWKRECEVYRSGLLDDLPGQFYAVRSYGVMEYPDEAAWVWMEDLRDDLSKPWPPEHYGEVARHLGQFNGAYLNGRPLPSAPWLGTGWLRKMTENVAPVIAQVQAGLNDPLLQSTLPPDASVHHMRLWDERERFLAALDRLPQVFCHQDIVERNLFARHGSNGQPATVAVDWAYVGTAAIGMDAALPVLVGLLILDIDARQTDIPALDRMIFDGYLAGLGDAGWNGDPRLVRTGYTAAAALKSIEVTQVALMLSDPDAHAIIEAFTGRPVSDVLQNFSAMFRFGQSMADEARALMDELD